MKKKGGATLIYSFLAINLPIFRTNSSRYDSYKIEIQIWGNLGYHYKGNINSENGETPHLLIKLQGDKQIFVNLIIKKDDNVDTFTSFIQVPKRYQTRPEKLLSTGVKNIVSVDDMDDGMNLDV